MEHVGRALGPQAPEEAAIFAEERFRVHVQAALYAAMRAEGISQKALAERMGVKPAYISQLFDTGRNLTVRTVGKVCFALNVDPRIVLQSKAAEVPLERHWHPKLQERAPAKVDVPSIAKDPGVAAVAARGRGWRVSVGHVANDSNYRIVAA